MRGLRTWKVALVDRPGQIVAVFVTLPGWIVRVGLRVAFGWATRSRLTHTEFSHSYGGRLAILSGPGGLRRYAVIVGPSITLLLVGYLLAYPTILDHLTLGIALFPAEFDRGGVLAQFVALASDMTDLEVLTLWTAGSCFFATVIAAEELDDAIDALLESGAPKPVVSALLGPTRVLRMVSRRLGGMARFRVMLPGAVALVLWLALSIRVTRWML